MPLFLTSRLHRSTDIDPLWTQQIENTFALFPSYHSLFSNGRKHSFAWKWKCKVRILIQIWIGLCHDTEWKWTTRLTCIISVWLGFDSHWGELTFLFFFIFSLKDPRWHLAQAECQSEIAICLRLSAASVNRLHNQSVFLQHTQTHTHAKLLPWLFRNLNARNKIQLSLNSSFSESSNNREATG